MGLLKVPSGKRLIIRSAGKGDVVEGVELVLDSEVTINISSRFSPFINNDVGKLANLLSLGLRATGINVGVTTKELGYQAWNGSDPISFSVTVMLTAKKDARTDVMEPVKKLVALPLPYQEAGTAGLLPPGPRIDQVVGKEFDLTSSASGRLSASIGNLNFDWVVVTKAEPTFSLDTDIDDYPIWATVTLDVSTVFSAYSNMLNNWGSGVKLF